MNANQVDGCLLSIVVLGLSILLSVAGVAAFYIVSQSNALPR